MKKQFLIAFGLSVIASTSMAATPVPIRERVNVGTLTSINDVVLDRKPVVLANGQYLGWVENVEYVGGGIVGRVKVTMNNYRDSVWLFREDVKFDTRNNVLVTSRSPDQIRKVTFLNF